MVADGGLATMVLVAALMAGASEDPAFVNPAELPVDSDAAIASSPSKSMQVCESGGMGAPECDIDCRNIFNFYTSSCGVSCRSGYFACCSCGDGCHCLMDHEEMWPQPEPGPVK